MHGTFRPCICHGTTEPQGGLDMAAGGMRLLTMRAISFSCGDSSTAAGGSQQNTHKTALSVFLEDAAAWQCRPRKRLQRGEYPGAASQHAATAQSTAATLAGAVCLCRLACPVALPRLTWEADLLAIRCPVHLAINHRGLARLSMRIPTRMTAKAGRQSP